MVGSGNVRRKRQALVTLLAGLLLAAGAAQGAWAQADEAGEVEREPVTMTIVDEDAVLLVTRVDGRDVVRVIGRTQVEHKSRAVWADQLEYDEAAGRATLTGSVELVDEGEDALNLTAQYLELDLNTDAAKAAGDVRFRRGEASGSADELYYGSYQELRALIEAELAGRSESVRRAVQETLQSFRDDDTIIVLKGRVDVRDGEREFQSEFVIINTRDDATVSLGRSAARLPGPSGE